jgi:three-Cys-motif partner protein
MSREEVIVVADDGLIAPEVGEWSEEKYKLISSYAQMFSDGMKNKWDVRTYVDLFAGAGRAKIRGVDKFVDTSAILAAKTATPFDKYIFCDLNSDKLSALEARVSKNVPGLDVAYIPGDVNKSCEKILGAIPRPSKGKRVLSFCVVDPFNTGDFLFETIRSLSKYFMDFLVLIPSGMDGNRNVKAYLEEVNANIERFLGNKNWRQDWNAFSKRRNSFSDFMIHSFCQSMVGLKYLDSEQHLKKIVLPVKNVLLYHLTFFSRDEMGLKFWKQSLKYSDQQTSFLDGM